MANVALPSLNPETGRLVVDRNGVLLRPFATSDGRWRLPVTLADVDPIFVKTLLAYEDRRFREHHGVDVRALFRAAFQLVTHGRIVSGASTITMQVARLLFEQSTRSVAGKLAQILMALALEKRLSKDGDPRPLPDARPLWRQHRGHPRRHRSPISARSRAG